MYSIDAADVPVRGNDRMDRGELSLIADLPLALGQESRILTADVHGITEGKKRKRLEVAVAIDGGCINIYDVCC